MPAIKIYNLRIVPPKPVFEEVTDIKGQFIERFGKQKYSKSKPQFPILNSELWIMNYKSFK